MRRLVLGLAMATLAMARPELYREKEDFQYSRSSTDEGTKSGFYDAQRGNMGGNYEKAHNMDTLAQHQMGGLVRQVEGELGDGSNTRTGSVFSAANSRGVYGSGHYDLSNLAGRNFREGVSYGESHQGSTSNSAHNAYLSSSNDQRYRTSSGHSMNLDSHQKSSLNSAYAAQLSSNNNDRYITSGGHSLDSQRGYQSSNQQEQNLYGANQFEQGMQAGQSSLYHSQSGYTGQNLYAQQVDTDHLNAQNTNTHHRLISTVPVKIIVRPGQRIAVPVATQMHRGSQIASIYDENAINKDTLVLSTNTHQQPLKPSGNGKHYESSYAYHKEWEKHDTRPAVVPLAISTIAPIPKNSELYDTHYNGNIYEQNANYNSASSQSQYQTDFNSKQHSSTSLNSNLNEYREGGANSKFDSQSANLIGVETSNPKSYQSSYSYHKSWERQGDPYIIKPAYNGGYEAQASGKLTDASSSQAAYSRQNYGSRQMQNQRYSSSNCNMECEPSHTRVARSYNSNEEQVEQQNQNKEHLDQQTQNQWDNLAELGQQTQDQWVEADNFGQQTLNKENLENFGQQEQSTWSQTEKNGQDKEKLEDFGQLTQETWSQAENEGQQAQNKWDQIENLSQQTQNNFNNLEDLGQQVQTKWDTNSENQYSQSQSNINEELEKQSQNKWNIDNTGQETENKWEQLEDLGQQTQTKWNYENMGQETQDFGQTQMNNGQQTQDLWGKLEDNGQQKSLEAFGQEVENKWHANNTQEIEKSQVSTEQPHSFWDKLRDLEQIHESGAHEEQSSIQHSFSSHDMSQQTSSVWETHIQDHFIQGNNENGEFHSQNFQGTPETTGSLSSLWGKLDSLDDDNTQYNIIKPNISLNSQQYNNNWHQQATSHHTVSNTDHLETSFNSQKSTEKSTEQRNDSHLIELPDIRTTTQEINTEKNDLQKKYENKQSTTTEKQIHTNSFRPIDVGRGDIGPEDSTVDALTTEKSNSSTNDKPSGDRFTVDVDINVPDTQVENVVLTKENKHNIEQESVENIFEQTENKKIEVEIAETSPEYELQNTQSVYVDQQHTQQNFETYDSHTFPEINKQNNKDVEEMPSESKQYQAPSANNSQQQYTEKEIKSFEQANDFGQENQDFIDMMKQFDSQNVYQQNNEQLSNFEQNPQDQQVHWNVDSENTEQQIVDKFSQQNQAPLSGFDQEFVDFSQQHDKLRHQKLQSNINSKPVPMDKMQILNEKTSQYNSNLSENNSPIQTDSDYSVLGIADNQKQDKSQNVVTELSSTETVTEKPGFWKSVGNKFSNVKSKVSSWFGS